MAAMSRLVEVLEAYRGRDKVIRLATYCSMLIGGSLAKSQFKGIGQSFLILSRNLNDCRTILRLFDDLSWFLRCKRYGLGFKESDGFLQLTTLLNNLFLQAYYPVEHVAWARDHNIIAGKSKNLWTLGILLWLGSLLVSIAQSLWILKNLKKSDYKSWYKAKQTQLIVGAVGNLADAGNAVHWLPGGMLWSGKLSQSMVGFLGMISSAALFYNYLYPVGQVVTKKSQ